ncbi:hypothetical protein HYDPIDRAFT_34345 [Hydnomerulius pinastri MD-312]|uniref:Uncharacterized protein n=1 Tax=Hydnomerulius pinastri MD-312 TaxID=994086 RepID=A0A0C9UZ28_9AGAM|nr:hypothetical protein HYDPIDRAFT_34345 [Hydnomerulius pinastri MD-312]
MANIIRSAKSGSDWTSNDLAAYNIAVHRQPADTFFGYTPSTISDGIDPAFLTATLPPNEIFLTKPIDSFNTYILPLTPTPARNQQFTILPKSCFACSVLKSEELSCDRAIPFLS